MNNKVLITILLFLVLSMIFYITYNRVRVQVWRRRFSEFPIRLFDMACGDINISTDNGLEIVKLKHLLDENTPRIKENI